MSHWNSDNQNPLVSIVILNFNSGRMLEQCLNSIAESTYKEKEVVIIDNNSTDDSVKRAVNPIEDRLKIKVLKLNSKVGFAKGNNIGAGYCSGEYIILLNNDTIVTSNWINSLVRTMNSDQSIAIAQCKLLQPTDNKFDSAGDFIDPFGHTFSRGRNEIDIGQFNETEEIFSARGAALIIRKVVLLQIGLLDDALFWSHEDFDLCWRARLKGYKIVYVPSSVVYHVGSSTIKKLDDSFLVYNQTRNMLIVFIKNQRFSELIFKSPVFMVFGCMIMDFIKRRGKLFNARLNALLKILFELKTIYLKRVGVNVTNKGLFNVKQTMLQTGCKDIVQLFFNSILSDEKLARKKYFSATSKERIILKDHRL